MFMVALARPRFDANHNMIFDGKIGIWPFTVFMKAKIPSNNRPIRTDRLYLSLLKSGLELSVLMKVVNKSLSTKIMLDLILVLMI